MEPRYGTCHTAILSHCVLLGEKESCRRVYQLPYTTHSLLIPGLCDTLPMIDLFYKRMLNFVYRCLNSQSSLVNFVTRHGILSGQMNSVLGRNVINCSLRYNTSVDCIAKLEFSPHNRNKYAIANQDILNTSALILELLRCRDGSYSLSNALINRTDINEMINILCTF